MLYIADDRLFMWKLLDKEHEDTKPEANETERPCKRRGEKHHDQYGEILGSLFVVERLAKSAIKIPKCQRTN